jgi:hypothetical protein
MWRGSEFSVLATRAVDEYVGIFTAGGEARSSVHPILETYRSGRISVVNVTV